MRELIARLARAREEKNIPLQEISYKTNIRLENLSRLESGDVSFQPYPYIKAMIRKYAEAIGEKIDPSELASIDPEPIVAPAFDAKASDEAAEALRKEMSQKKRLLYASVSGLLVAIMLAFAIGRLTKPSDESSAPKAQPIQATNAPKPSPPVAAPSPEPKASASQPPADARKPVAESAPQQIAEQPKGEKKHTLIVRSKTDSCWISVASDKNAAKEMLLAPSASATFDADSLFTLTVGKLETAELWLNGKPVALPRRSGMISGFKLTPPKD
ncbi:MAG: helix-turn-helix domain-containing protein [Chloroherpetonaceae bacterium]|nr:helix-turn-helix domain-containing protein [Chloroherpetonaceae bacterium]MDW8437586.1 helix-turn-helix domain-containing protein [Chloroherpetonaceae bacterium]